MKLGEMLAAQVERVRGFTLTIAKEFSDGDMMYQPKEGLNHPLWILGHIALSQDSLIRAMCCGKEKKRPDWAALFGMKTKPSADRGAYPSREAILNEMAAIQRESVEALRAMPDEELFAPLPKGVSGPPFLKMRADAAMLAISHEGMHQGQLLYLRRMLGKPPMM